MKSISHPYEAMRRSHESVNGLLISQKDKSVIDPSTLCYKVLNSFQSTEYFGYLAFSSSNAPWIQIPNSKSKSGFNYGTSTRITKNNELSVINYSRFPINHLKRLKTIAYLLALLFIV